MKSLRNLPPTFRKREHEKKTERKNRMNPHGAAPENPVPF